MKKSSLVLDHNKVITSKVPQVKIIVKKAVSYQDWNSGGKNYCCEMRERWWSSTCTDDERKQLELRKIRERARGWHGYIIMRSNRRRGMNDVKNHYWDMSSKWTDLWKLPHKTEKERFTYEQIDCLVFYFEFNHWGL